MASRERRIQTTEAALIGALFVVFATLLYPLFARESESSVVAAPSQLSSGLSPSTDSGSVSSPRLNRRLISGAENGESLAVAVAPSEDLKQLERDVSVIIANAMASARKLSKGRVRSADVTVAVHARDLKTGRVVLAVNDSRPLRPASGMKLMTTAAALVLLGSDWHFETGFDSAGPIGDGILSGDLIVRAGGDPLYAGNDSNAVAARLGKVASALKLQGIRRISGDLVLDLSSFDDPEPGPEWPDASQYWQEHCALAAGLTANAGVLATRVTATSVGQKAKIEVWPSAHGLESRYTTVTVKEKINDVRVGATRRAVTVGGKIGRSVGVVEAQFSHPDPVGLFASSLLEALRVEGISISGETRIVREAPEAARLFTLRSALRSTLIPINTDSVNGVADQVFFATGRAVIGRGSRAAGGLATAEALSRLGVPADGLVQVDGSGLSRANRVSARQLATLLAAVLDPGSATGEAYRASLAVAGESGTLENRMRDGLAKGRVFAKTGWISGTSSLSGLALAVDGGEWVFSILVEYPASESGLNTKCFKPMHDAIAERLVRGLGL